MSKRNLNQFFAILALEVSLRSRRAAITAKSKTFTWNAVLGFLFSNSHCGGLWEIISYHTWYEWSLTDVFPDHYLSCTAPPPLSRIFSYTFCQELFSGTCKGLASAKFAGSPTFDYRDSCSTVSIGYFFLAIQASKEECLPEAAHPQVSQAHWQLCLWGLGKMRVM